MAKSTVIAAGPEWRLTPQEGFFEAWGRYEVPPGTEPDDESTWTKLGDLVVERFEAIAQDHGVMVAWVPDMEQVIGPVGEGEALAGRLGDWRRQAEAEIKASWQVGEIPGVFASAD